MTGASAGANGGVSEPMHNAESGRRLRFRCRESGHHVYSRSWPACVFGTRQRPCYAPLLGSLPAWPTCHCKELGTVRTSLGFALLLPADQAPWLAPQRDYGRPAELR
jgi:hypothetical protein